MKYYKIYLLFGLLLSILNFSCKESNSPDNRSFIEKYSPTYKTEKGTIYQGNFFPVFEGKKCSYEGTANGTMKTRIHGTYYGEKVDDKNQLDITAVECVAFSEILGQMNLDIEGQSFTLWPELQYSYLGLDGSTIDTCRFFEVTEDEVLIKVIPQAGGYIIVEDPVFIKSSLVVGDNWMSQPSINSSSFSPEESIEITGSAKCQMYVIGEDSIEICDQTNGCKKVKAIQVDQIAEIKGTCTTLEDEESGTFYSEYLAHLYLVENIGIAATDEHIKINIKSTSTDQDASLTTEITIEIFDQLHLVNYISDNANKNEKILAKSSGKIELDKKLPLSTRKMTSKILQAIGTLKP